MEKLEERFNLIIGLQSATSNYNRVCAREARKIAIEFADCFLKEYMLSSKATINTEELFNKFIEEYEK